MRVLIICIDGAPFSRIKLWIENKRLPFLTRLARSGSLNKLISVTPPISPVAWASFITGKEPAKHGIYDFALREPGGYAMKPVTLSKVKGVRLWQILNKFGKKVGIIRLPICFPPEPIDGFMISGRYFTSRTMTYPPNLREELKRKVGKYAQESLLVKFGQIHDKDKFRYMEEMNRYVNSVATETCYLMEKYEWDCLVTTFVSTDRVQHDFWPDEEFILAHYQVVDEAVGRILQRIDDDTVVFVISDHGASEAIKEFNLDFWLLQNGLISLKEFSSLVASSIRTVLNKMPTSIVKLIKTMFPIELLSKLHRSLPSLFPESINWNKTRAFCTRSLQNCSGVFINLKGRERNGVEDKVRYDSLRSKLIANLLEIIDPDNGVHVVEEVSKKENLYSSPLLAELPDLIVRMRRGYRVYPNLLVRKMFISSIDKGVHDWEGILIASGKNIAKCNDNKDASLLDLLPTILHIMDVPIPSDVDGRVLTEIFAEGSDLANRKLEYQLPESEILRESAGYENKLLEQEVKERLRQLGYL